MKARVLGYDPVTVQSEISHSSVYWSGRVYPNIKVSMQPQHHKYLTQYSKCKTTSMTDFLLSLLICRWRRPQQ